MGRVKKTTRGKSKEAVLAFLASGNGPWTVTEIAQACGLNYAAASTLLGRAVKAGVVIRRIDGSGYDLAERPKPVPVPREIPPERHKPGLCYQTVIEKLRHDRDLLNRAIEGLETAAERGLLAE